MLIEIGSKQATKKKEGNITTLGEKVKFADVQVCFFLTSYGLQINRENEDWICSVNTQDWMSPENKNGKLRRRCGKLHLVCFCATMLKRNMATLWYLFIILSFVEYFCLFPLQHSLLTAAWSYSTNCLSKAGTGNWYIFTTVAMSQGHVIAICDFPSHFWQSKSMREVGFP